MGDIEASRNEHARSWLLLSLMLGNVTAVVSSTIFNIAVPDLMRDFGIGQERAQWVAAGFLAAMTVSMLPTPWLLKRHGCRRIFGAAVLLLMLGSLVGGCVMSFELVLAMRVLQGLAAGILQVMPAIVILYAFEPGTQGRALGILSLGVVLAPALGPSLGGALVDSFGWRSIFFCVVPFTLVSYVLSRRWVPREAPSGKAAGAGTDAFDFGGLVLAGAGLLLLLNGLVHLHDADLRLAALLLAASMTMCCVFVLHQRRAAAPLLNLDVFASVTFSAASIVAFVYGSAIYGSAYVVPVFLQMGLQQSAVLAGAVMLPAGAVLAITVTLAGRMADRFSPHRLVVLGLGTLAISFALMGSVHLVSSPAAVVGMIVLGRVGLGIVMPSLSLGAVRGLEPLLLSHAAGTIAFLRQLGGVVGIGVIGTVLEWRMLGRESQPVVAFAEVFGLLAGIVVLATLAALVMGRRAASSPPAGAGEL